MFDVPTTNTSIDRYRMTAWSYFDSTGDSPSPSLYYYIEDDGIYYKIKREEYIDGDVAYYNLFIIRINGQKLYLICTKDGSNFRTELSPDALLSNNNSPNQILLVGYLAGKDGIGNGLFHHQRGQHTNGVDIRLDITEIRSRSDQASDCNRGFR